DHHANRFVVRTQGQLNRGTRGCQGMEEPSPIGRLLQKFLRAVILCAIFYVPEVENTNHIGRSSSSVIMAGSKKRQWTTSVAVVLVGFAVLAAASIGAAAQSTDALIDQI